MKNPFLIQKDGSKDNLEDILVNTNTINLIFISYRNIINNNSNNNSDTNLNNTYNSNKNIIMYFPTWEVYSEYHNNLTVGDIPWNKVTVINHAFFTVSKDFKLETTDKDADFEKSFPNSEGWEQG